MVPDKLTGDAAVGIGARWPSFERGPPSRPGGTVRADAGRLTSTDGSGPVRVEDGRTARGPLLDGGGRIRFQGQRCASLQLMFLISAQRSGGCDLVGYGLRCAHALEGEFGVAVVKFDAVGAAAGEDGGHQSGAGTGEWV